MIWLKTRFGVQYVHCGCPLPGETVGQRLLRLIGAYTRRTPSFLNPPNIGEALTATHPSDCAPTAVLDHVKNSEREGEKVTGEGVGDLQSDDVQGVVKTHTANSLSTRSKLGIAAAFGALATGYTLGAYPALTTPNSCGPSCVKLEV